MNGSTTPHLRVAIIGGGIGGLCLATALFRHEHLDVQIYEAAPEFSEIGAGLTFSRNAQEAMKIISPSLFETYDRLKTPNLWPGYENNYMLHKIGYGKDAGKVIGNPQVPGGHQSLHRARFLEEVVGGIPPERSHLNKRLIAIEQDSANHSAPLTLHFSDGTAVATDLVIGADGIRSFVRKEVLGENHPAVAPVFAGCVAYRGVVPMNMVREKLGAEQAENAVIMCGPGKAIFTYPLQKGETVNVVVMDYTRKKWDYEEWRRPCERYELEKAFKGWPPHAQSMIEILYTNPGVEIGNLTKTPIVEEWGLHHHPWTPTFYKGRVALLGDAAHASTPYQGQGAGHAIEDAAVLDALLSRTTRPEQVDHAFGAYDQVRRPRALRMVKTSRDAGDLLGMQMEGIGDDVEKMREELERRFFWLWNRDQEAQRRTAVELFEESLGPRPHDSTFGKQ